MLDLFVQSKLITMQKILPHHKDLVTQVNFQRDGLLTNFIIRV